MGGVFSSVNLGKKLFKYAREGNVDGLREIVGKYDLNMGIFNRKGNTMLHEAVLNGQVEVVKFLLTETRIDFTQANFKGFTAFHLAMQKLPENAVEMVEVLLSSQEASVVNLPLQNELQQTALHLLAMKFDDNEQDQEKLMQIFELIIRLDGNAYAVDGNGFTPLDLVRDDKKRDLLKRKIEQYKKEMGDEFSGVIQMINVLNQKEDNAIDSKLEELGIKRNWLGNEAKRLLKTPGCFTCPITKKIMKNPVITSLGTSYEATAISEEMGGEKVDPLTGKKIDEILIPNYGLKGLIAHYVESTAKQCLEIAREFQIIQKPQIVEILIKRAEELSASLQARNSAITEEIEKAKKGEFVKAAPMDREEFLQRRFAEMLEEKEHYRGKVSLEFMQDPVVVSSGQNYSRGTALNLLGQPDPATREVLTSHFRRNCNFQSAIESYTKRLGGYIGQLNKEDFPQKPAMLRQIPQQFSGVLNSADLKILKEWEAKLPPAEEVDDGTEPVAAAENPSADKIKAKLDIAHSNDGSRA